MPFFTDRAEIKGSARITRDGYFVADAMVAKANNIQEYRAAELGLTDRAPDAVVRVFRPEAVVFDKDALAGLAHRPITLDHPSEAVTSANWKQYAVGDVGDEIMRDGDRVRVPVKVMDAAAVDSMATDRREFSLGYAATLDMAPGEFDGQAYDAALASVSYNHLAAVKAARGGSELRIVDERPNDRRKPNPDGPVSSPQDQSRKPNMHTLIIDGLQVTEVSDQAKAAIEKLQGQVKDAAAAKDTAEAKIGELTATVSTKDGEIAALNAKLKDAEVTPAKLQLLADARAKLIADAKKVDPNLVTDGKTDAEIKKAVVTAKLGDAAKDMADAAIDGAFSVLVAAPANDGLRNVITSGPASVGDAAGDYAKARDAAKAAISNGWKTPATTAAAA